MGLTKHLRYMEDQSLALLLVVLVHQLCIQGCHGDTAQNVIIAENNPANFLCNVDNVVTTIWLFTRRDGGTDHETLSQGANVYPRFENKFTLEILDGSPDNTTSHSLTLKFNGTEEDEGLYLCQEEGNTMAQFNLTVEIPTVLHLEMNNTVVGTNVDVVFNEEVTIGCIANRGKPPVKLSWMVNGEEKTGSSITNPPPSSERSVTSIIHYIPVIEDNILTCVASGQQVIPEKEVSVRVNVQYLLNCLIVITNDTNAFIITCSCEANPDVETYKIYVNKTLYSTKMETTLLSDKGATVFCNATNKVGSYTTNEVVLKPFHEEVPPQVTRFALIICLTVAGVVGIIIIIVAGVLIRKKMKDEKKEKEEKETHREVMSMSLKALPPEEDPPEERNTQEKKLMEDNDDKEAVSTGNEI